MITKQKREGLDQVPGPYQIAYVVTDGSGNVTVNGVAISGTTVELAVYQTTVFVDANGTDAPTIQLPAVAAANGLTYLIRVTDFGGGVKIADADDSLEWTDKTTTADGQYVLVKAQGDQWVILATDIS